MSSTYDSLAGLMEKNKVHAPVRASREFDEEITASEVHSILSEGDETVAKTRGGEKHHMIHDESHGSLLDRVMCSALKSDSKPVEKSLDVLWDDIDFCAQCVARRWDMRIDNSK